MKRIWALIIIIVLSVLSAQAQTTAFTYQGRFTDSTAAQPTNGTYTMTFRLYDAATGGNLIPDSSTAVTSMVSVVSGIFTTRLDFGAAAFNTTLTASNARYLEIQVGSIVLTPRQEITSTPFAMRSINAATADGLSVNCVGCVTNANINAVDGAKINGSVANATTAQNSEQLGGTAASNFVQTDSNVFLRNQTIPQSANFNINGTGSIGGNVGIGTTATTTEALRVVGTNGGNTTNTIGGTGEGISLQAGSGGSSSGNTGGNGAGISLQAGNGGSGGSTFGGNGGSITLQPGSGANGTFNTGTNGKVLLAPNNGNVGIGTTNPTSKLFVNGDLTVTGTINGTINSLGQEATTVYGTGGLTVTRTNTNFVLVPGLTQTINVAADTFPVIVIATDGGIQTLSTTSDGKSIVEVAIYVDGTVISARQHHLSNDSIAPAIVNWALSYSQLLTPGSHTIEVRARSTSDSFLSNATVSGGGGGNSVLRGQLTVTTIKR